MSNTNLKLESGIQLLKRLMKKPDIEKFYSTLFQNQLKIGYVIELFSDGSTHALIIDIICEFLLPIEFGGTEGSVLIFSTDGKLDLNIVVECLKSKLFSHIKLKNLILDTEHYDCKNLESILQTALKRLFILEIFDVTQFYITMQNLENILIKHSDISFIVFDTLTGFYWSEQRSKPIKMDSYIKSLLKLIQKVIKDYKVTLLYTRPEYFSSSKEVLENLEPCCEQPTFENINYRIQLTSCNDGTYVVNVRTYDKQYKKMFNVCDGFLKWL